MTFILDGTGASAKKYKKKLLVHRKGLSFSFIFFVFLSPHFIIFLLKTENKIGKGSEGYWET